MAFEIRITLIGGAEHTKGTFGKIKVARHHAVINATNGFWRKGTDPVKWIYIPARRIQKVEVVKI